MNGIPGMVQRLDARRDQRSRHNAAQAIDIAREGGLIDHIPLPSIEDLLALANERENRDGVR